MGWGLSPVAPQYLPSEHRQGMVVGEVEHEMTDLFLFPLVDIQSNYKGEVGHWKFPGETLHSCHFLSECCSISLQLLYKCPLSRAVYSLDLYNHFRKKL